MKKFWNWLIGNPYVVYVGNNKYSVRVREGLLTCGIGTDLYTWYTPECQRLYCQYDKKTALNVKNDYIQTKKWIEQ